MNSKIKLASLVPLSCLKNTLRAKDLVRALEDLIEKNRPSTEQSCEPKSHGYVEVIERGAFDSKASSREMPLGPLLAVEKSCNTE